MSDDMFASPDPTLAVQERWHTEQRRRQYDIIRVLNPTNEDFFVEYDTNQFQRIPANSTRDIPRHRAERYIEHMKDQILHAKGQKMHDDFIADRRKKGMPDYKDKATENAETYETSAYPKTNDPKLIAELYDQLWVGLVNKAGSDIPPARQTQQNELNRESVSTQELKKLETKLVSSEDRPPVMREEPPISPNPVYAPIEQPQPSAFSQMNEKLDESEVSA